MAQRRPLRERLFSRLIITDPPTAEDRLGRPIVGPCLIWTGATDSKGYGVIGLGGRSAGIGRTHRVAYELLIGEKPPSELDHLCRILTCASPAHLEAVSHLENIQRGDWQQRNQSLKAMTHCKRGHEFTPENTYITSLGGRQCRTCVRDRRREVYDPEARHQKHLKRRFKGET